MNKTCIKCGASHPVEKFDRAPGNADGRNNRCRQCLKAYHAANYKKKKVQILGRNAKWRSVNKKRMAELAKCWREKNKEKTRAYMIVDNERKAGRLVKLPCQVCGSLKAQAHHEDYSKPLELIWLCKTHHEERHHG